MPCLSDAATDGHHRPLPSSRIHHFGRADADLGSAQYAGQLPARISRPPTGRHSTSAVRNSPARPSGTNSTPAERTSLELR